MICCTSFFKGQCHEIFDPWLFQQTIPPRALSHGLKPFRIWLRIRDEIDSKISKTWSLGVNDTAGYDFFVRVVTCNLCIYFCYGFPLKGMRQSSFSWMTPRRHRGVNDTAESASAVSLRLRNLLQKCLSQIPRYNWKWNDEMKMKWTLSHMRNGFSPWIGALEGIVWGMPGTRHPDPRTWVTFVGKEGKH
jgi:hypothetical protein